MALDVDALRHLLATFATLATVATVATVASYTSWPLPRSCTQPQPQSSSASSASSAFPPPRCHIEHEHEREQKHQLQRRSLDLDHDHDLDLDDDSAILTPSSESESDSDSDSEPTSTSTSTSIPTPTPTPPSPAFKFAQFDVDHRTGFAPNGTDEITRLSSAYDLWELHLASASSSLSLGEDTSPPALARRPAGVRWRSDFLSVSTPSADLLFPHLQPPTLTKRVPHRHLF
jgi:hypothetical protein